MKQWEIYLYPYRALASHPVVILSSDERCENADLQHVNALLCTSVRLNRNVKAHETVLDEADGLDWKTAVRCDFIYALPKAEFKERRGNVSRSRRIAISRKLVECLRLPLDF
jgi:mRNA-degrading endonuclease toxin of MazEF toxin-antitoxin module